MAHQQRGVAWALFSDKSGAHFVNIHKAAARFFAAQPVTRVEAYIDSEFPAARRWIKALGFSCECSHMRDFLPGGRAAELWTRFNS